MVCGKCSAINDDGDRFCYKCGSPLPVAASANAGENAAGAAYGEKNRPGNGFKFNFGQRASQQTAPPVDEGFKPTSEDRLAISATTSIAVKKARIADVKSMRPLTQAAYSIVESDRGPVLSTLISVLNVLISLGIVSTIITAFDTIKRIIAASTGSEVAGSLSDFAYKNASAQDQQKLVWLGVIFVVLCIAFVTCGRLSIRIKKVNRKKRRSSLASRID